MRLSFCLLLLAAVALPACDSNGSYDDGFIDGSVANGATYVDFSLDSRNYEISSDQRTATYDSRDINIESVRDAVAQSLARAGDGALVMLYIRNNLVNIDFGGDSQPYTALPLTRAFEEVVLASREDGSLTTVPVVGYTASYEYSFDNEVLYFDVVSSGPASSFPVEAPEDFFDYIVPQLRGSDGLPSSLTQLRFRLVTVPANPGARSAIDLTDYAAVKAAYDLPD